MVGCHDGPSVAVTRGASLRAIAARCRSDVGGRSAGRGREPLLLRREAAAEPRLGGTTTIANGQLTRPLALRPNESLHLTKARSAPRGSIDHVRAFAGELW